MSDIDELVESGDLNQDDEDLLNREPISEKMESPNKKKNHVVVLAIISFFILILFTFIYKSGNDSENDGVDSIAKEKAEVAEQNKVDTPRKLVKPSIDEVNTKKIKTIDKELSLKDKLKEQQALLKDELNNQSSGINFLKNRERREEEAKKRDELRNEMDARRSASMSSVKSNSGRNGNIDTSINNKRAQIDSARSTIEQLRNNATSKQNSSSFGSFGKQNDEYDTKLMNLPVAESSTVEAIALADLDWLVTEGTVLQATIESAINSSLAGKIRAITMFPVYSYTGNLVVIPQASTLIGEYTAAATSGEPRIFIIWTRIITPDGLSINIGSQGIDQLGRAGIEGAVNTHFLKRFGSSVLLSVISGYAQAAAENPSQVSALADSFNKSSEIALNSTIGLAPTITRNQGTRVAVFLNSDINFKNAMAASVLAKNRISNMSNTASNVGIPYDRVFDNRELTHKERALLGNRFLADEKFKRKETYTVKPYIAVEGDSLRKTISDWCARNNYFLEWNVYDEDGSSLNWDLPTDVTMHGTLVDVVGKLMEAYINSGVNLEHRFYAMNSVLEITMKESK